MPDDTLAGSSGARHYEVALLGDVQVRPTVAPIPGGFECPLTLEIMKDPVMTVGGQVFERLAIEKWFREGERTCSTKADRCFEPFTGAVASNNYNTCSY